MAKKILIVSQVFEPSVNLVVEHLSRRGIEWIRVNCEEFPLFCDATVRLDSDGPIQAKVSFERQTLDVSEIGSVWYRRVAASAVPKGLRPKERDFIQNESRAYLNGIFSLLDCLWVNDRKNELFASNKTHQLAVARQIGFRIPRTLITNDEQTVRAFVHQTTGPILFKPVSGFAPNNVNYIPQLQRAKAGEVTYELDDGDFDESHTDVVFSQILTEDKLNSISQLKLCPAIFQEYVEKDLEVRVTIVGSEIFACEIHSQTLNETKVDFRRMALLGDPGAVQHSPHDLPSAIAERLLNMMRVLGLLFACFDLILTPDGEYVFLEVNPSGQWLWIEQLVGFRISECLANLLISAL